MTTSVPSIGTEVAYIEISLRIYLVVSLFKNETMGQKRLTNLSLLRIESDLLRKLDFTDIINDFSSKSTRRVSFNYSSKLFLNLLMINVSYMRTSCAIYVFFFFNCEFFKTCGSRTIIN